MGCMLWGSCSDMIHQSEFEPTGDTLCIALRDKLWCDFCEDPLVVYQLNFELKRDTPRIALTDEPWGIGYEGPVAMQYIDPNLNSRHPMYCPYGRVNVCLCWGVMTLNINHIMNSLMMPHVSPRWMSHGVSVVMILVNIDNVMATPQFIFQQHM